LTMAMVGVIFSGRMTSSALGRTGDSNAATAGAVIGGGISAAVTGGISLFMAIACLVGFAVAYFMGREMKDTSVAPTRKCPECAEMVQIEARKCRYCGAALASPSANVVSTAR